MGWNCGAGLSLLSQDSTSLRREVRGASSEAGWVQQPPAPWEELPVEAGASPQGRGHFQDTVSCQEMNSL